MLFPMAMEIPPTDYCLRGRPWFILLLVMQLALSIGRFLVNDIWGALTLVMVTLIGSFVVSGDCGINVMNCLYYAMMAGTCGIFDLLLCVMYFQNSVHGLLSKRASSGALLAQVVFILSPIVEFLSAYLAWTFFSDCRRQAEENTPLLPGPAVGGGYMSATDLLDEHRERARAAAERRDRERQSESFRAFQGKAHTLSGDA